MQSTRRIPIITKIVSFIAGRLYILCQLTSLKSVPQETFGTLPCHILISLWSWIFPFRLLTASQRPDKIPLLPLQSLRGFPIPEKKLSYNEHILFYTLFCRIQVHALGRFESYYHFGRLFSSAFFPLFFVSIGIHVEVSSEEQPAWRQPASFSWGNCPVHRLPLQLFAWLQI